MASFVLSFFPLDVLDGIWDLIESVSEVFLTYSCQSHFVLDKREFPGLMVKRIRKDKLYGVSVCFVQFSWRRSTGGSTKRIHPWHSWHRECLSPLQSEEKSCD